MKDPLKDPWVFAEETRDRVREMICDLGRLMDGASRDDQIKYAVLIQLLTYMHLQLDRLVKWSTETVDMLAWAARNILEAKLWIAHLYADPKNFLAFIREAEVDWKELLQKTLALKLTKHSTDAKYLALELERIVKARQRTRESLKRVSLRAASEADALTYQYCSKYIHASSWLIQDSEQLRSETNRILFILVGAGDAELALLRVKLDLNTANHPRP